MPGNRISIMSLNYPPEATGIAPYAGGLASGLSARANDVTAYVAHPSYPQWTIRPGYGQWKRSESIDGVTVLRFLHYVPRPPRGVRRLLSEVSFGLRMAFCKLYPHSITVAVSPALFATAIAALRMAVTPSRPPLIVWVQDIYTLGLLETREGGGLSARITKIVERAVLRAADRVVAIHPRFSEYITQDLGVDAKRVTVIRNWTHLPPAPAMSKQQARDALGWPSDVLLVVHTGNMGVKQGLENVVEAARVADRRQENILFVLVGDGGERQKLEGLAAGVDRIIFVDPLNDADYRCALFAADYLLVNESPGIASMAVPSKLTSYFDAARPILAATNPGGITADEIRHSGAGVAVPAGDPYALLDAALQLASDSDKTAAYGAAGRHYRMEVLSADAAVSAFERVIEEVVSDRGRVGTGPCQVGVTRRPRRNVKESRE